MTASDLEQLLEMGFEKERAELAVSKTGGRTFQSFSLKTSDSIYVHANSKLV
jgi:hypothetical protein